MRRNLFFLGMWLAVTCPVALAAEDGTDLAPAMRVAQAWIETVDAERYGESWEASADLFKQSMPKVRWEASIQSIRASLGAVFGRKVHSANYVRQVPGAPPGEYVVIEFRTQFEKRPLAIETVTPMRAEDGAWKVSGYRIR